MCALPSHSCVETVYIGHPKDRSELACVGGPGCPCYTCIDTRYIMLILRLVSEGK